MMEANEGKIVCEYSKHLIEIISVQEAVGRKYKPIIFTRISIELSRKAHLIFEGCLELLNSLI
jgi:hypothetical protein